MAIIQSGRLAALGTIGELKSASADRPILEVRASDSVKAMTALDGLRDVEKTSLFGTAVHAVLRSRTTTPESITAALLEAGVRADSVQPVVPSLEDVFLDVVDRAALARPG